MPTTRRGILLSGCTLSLLSGCAGLGGPSGTIDELEVVLVNGQDEPLTFEFALETPDGVGEWSSYDVGPDERKSVTVTPPEADVVAIRASVADHSLSADLLEHGSGEVCPKLYIEFELADRPTILESADASC